MVHFFIPSALSISRVFIALLFYAVSQTPLPSVYWLLLLFGLIELTDLLDGITARWFSAVSSIGKLLDPICDVSAHFLCLFSLYTLYIAPPVVFIIYMLRELWIMFFRIIILNHGTVFAAQWSGKVKTWLYAFAIFFSIVMLPHSPFSRYFQAAPLTAFAYLQLLYYAAAFFSVFSALHYVYKGVILLRRRSRSID